MHKAGREKLTLSGGSIPEKGSAPKAVLFGAWCFMHILLGLLSLSILFIGGTNLRWAYHWEKGQMAGFFRNMASLYVDSIEVFWYFHAFGLGWALLIWIRVFALPPEKLRPYKLSLQAYMPRAMTIVMAIVFVAIASERRPFGHADKTEVYLVLAGAVVLLSAAIKLIHAALDRKGVFERSEQQ